MFSRLKKEMFFMLLMLMMTAFAATAYGAESEGLTREGFVDLLWQEEERPIVQISTSFDDTDASQLAINWAVANGLLVGTDMNQCAPAMPITREQAAVILSRYAQWQGEPLMAEYDLKKFSDAAKSSSWAISALRWAVGRDILPSVQGNLMPQQSLTLAQAQAMLERYNELAVATHTLGLSSIANARQLGGYPVADGYIKDGLLLRTGNLAHASEEELERLSDLYQLSAIVDLRTDEEIAAAPDVAVNGTDWYNLKVLQKVKANANANYSTDDIIKMLQDSGPRDQVYVNMAFDEYAQKAYRQFFAILLEQPSDKGILWHCTSGKDRTGVMAALVLSALGADRETILQDFESSNIYFAKGVNALAKQVAEKTDDPLVMEGAQSLVGVSRRYMENMLDAIDARYGSMDNYLAGPIGLSEQDMAKLRQKYVE